MELKLQKGKKSEDKDRNKENGKQIEIVMNILDVNPVMPMTTLNVSDLNGWNERDCWNGSKNKTQLYILYNKLILNIKKHME